MRYEFGKNWQSFNKSSYTEERLKIAKESILSFIHLDTLNGKTFLDIGSGKGMTIKDFINKKIDEKKTIIDYKKPNSLIANIKKLERKIGKKNV